MHPQTLDSSLLFGTAQAAVLRSKSLELRAKLPLGRTRWLSARLGSRYELTRLQVADLAEMLATIRCTQRLRERRPPNGERSRPLLP